MPLLWAVVLGTALGVARFGGPWYLRRLPIRAGWLFLMALIVQLVSVRAVAPGGPGEIDPRGLLFLLGYAGVLVGVTANWRVPAFRILGLGFALNLIAVAPHAGYMPISVAAYEASGQARATDDLSAGARLARAKDVVLPREQTPLWPLTDVLPVRDPAWLRGVYSPGDLIVAAGVAWLAAGAGMSRPARQRPSLAPGTGGAT